MILARIRLVSENPPALAAFYQTALGFTIGLTQAAGLIRLHYGESEIEIIGFPQPGRHMPVGQASNDGSFQHFAMLVNDIGAAHAKLAGSGFTAISAHGPVALPAASGGVTAFKFRDPEGHPLEFLQPLHPQPPGIDHTAIVVADTKTSVAFYAGYGLEPQGGSLNFGPQQAALDNLEAPIVKVTRLKGAGKLALELLCYHQPAGAQPWADKVETDAVSTCLVFSGAKLGRTRDPDGHDILVEA